MNDTTGGNIFKLWLLPFVYTTANDFSWHPHNATCRGNIQWASNGSRSVSGRRSEVPERRRQMSADCAYTHRNAVQNTEEDQASPTSNAN